MWRVIIAILAALAIAVVVVVFNANSTVNKPLNIDAATLYTIKPGKSYNHLLSDFKKRGYIDSRFSYRLHAKLNPTQVRLKAGTFEFQPNMSMIELLALVQSGMEYQFKITFVEGSTFKEWLLQLANTPYIKKTLDGKTPLEIVQSIDATVKHPEGLFFPSTYQYVAHTSDIDILKQAFKKMQVELQSSWENKQPKLPYKSPYEALIMASLIEKETGQVFEQPIIAAVFINRLAKKMRLQTDPTIIYGLGDRYTGDITYANIREKTAYNTYRIDGMPPTPIAMPGKSAIEASLNPVETKYLYFVSKGNGEHHFSTTLREHNNAVNKYIRGK